MSTNNNFQDRVNYAARVISTGRNTSRAFDNCFENHDGDEVATIVYRRSLNNPKLRANIWRYLSKETVMPAVKRLSHILTRDMPKQSEKTREKSRRDFNAMMARRAV